MKEKILEILKEETKGQNINEINNKLHLRGMEEITELEDNLKELVTEGILHMSKNREYMFRACFLDPTQGETMADFTNDTLKVKKVAIVYDLSDASK